MYDLNSLSSVVGLSLVVWVKGLLCSTGLALQ